MSLQKSLEASEVGKTNNIIYRYAKPEDKNTIIQLKLQLTEELEGHPLKEICEQNKEYYDYEKIMRNLIHDVEKNIHNYILATDADKVVGMIRMDSNNLLSDSYVLESWRGNGIGTSLTNIILKEEENKLEIGGIKELYVVVEPKKAEFYRELGFKQIGTNKGFGSSDGLPRFSKLISKK